MWRSLSAALSSLPHSLPLSLYLLCPVIFLHPLIFLVFNHFISLTLNCCSALLVQSTTKYLGSNALVTFLTLCDLMHQLEYNGKINKNWTLSSLL